MLMILFIKMRFPFVRFIHFIADKRNQVGNIIYIHVLLIHVECTFLGARRPEASLLLRVDHEFLRDRSIRDAGRERGEFGPRSSEPRPLPVSSGRQRKNGCRRFCAIVLRCDIERR